MSDDYSGITRSFGDTPHTVDHPATSFDVSDDNSALSTGDLRRGFDFGKTYTLLSYKRDPFLHFLNMFNRRPVGDSKFKYTLKRAGNVYRRYAYVMGVTANGELCTQDETVVSTESSWIDAAYRDCLEASWGGGGSDGFGNDDIPATAGNQFSVMMGGDYNQAAGNKINTIDGYNSSPTPNFKCGVRYTRPKYFLVGQMIKIPVSTTAAVDYDHSSVVNIGGFHDPTDYVLCRITAVYDWTGYKTGTTTSMGEGKILNLIVVRGNSSTVYPTSLQAASWASGTATIPEITHGVGTKSVAQKLEKARSYVVGSAFHELSGYGETWRPQPYSTEIGYTQIFKVTAMMSGRAMATELKFESNPWAEEWETKMMEMNNDLAWTAYFGEQYEDTTNGFTYTQGAIPYILDNSNLFDLTLSEKTLDDFLDDMSAFNDPRFHPDMGANLAYFCRTDVFNWFHKIGGFGKNNLEVSPNFTLEAKGLLKAGVDYSSFSVLGGKMNVIRDIHLDGTNVKMLAIDMRHAYICPFIGNTNRDVHVYPGVKTLANSGEDYRVDLIQGDIGFDFDAPELHAVWQ